MVEEKKKIKQERQQQTKKLRKPSKTKVHPRHVLYFYDWDPKSLVNLRIFLRVGDFMESLIRLLL